MDKSTPSKETCQRSSDALVISYFESVLRKGGTIELPEFGIVIDKPSKKLIDQDEINNE